jgi:hypothetical protein
LGGRISAVQGKDLVPGYRDGCLVSLGTVGELKKYHVVMREEFAARTNGWGA